MRAFPHTASSSWKSWMKRALILLTADVGELAVKQEELELPTARSIRDSDRGPTLESQKHLTQRRKVAKVAKQKGALACGSLRLGAFA
jgi:hypothetical protein